MREVTEPCGDSVVDSRVSLPSSWLIWLGLGVIGVDIAHAVVVEAQEYVGDFSPLHS